MKGTAVRPGFPRVAAAALVLAFVLGYVTHSVAQIVTGVSATTRVAKPVAASAKSGAGKVRTDATGSCPGGAVSCTSGTSVRPSADPLGVTDDDFPAGGQFPVGWTTPPGADAGWIVASDFANQGTFSLKSATITHEQWAVTQVAGVFAAGTVSFAYRVSSEPGFDILDFLIDGVAQGVRITF